MTRACTLIRWILITGLAAIVLTGCGDGDGSSGPIPSQLVGTWDQHLELSGPWECDGDVIAYDVVWDFVFTIYPDSVSVSPGGPVLSNWDGNNLFIDWTFSMQAGPDPECGMQMWEYGYHYEVSFNQDWSVGTTTGSYDFAMTDDCMDCTGHFDITGSMTKR